MSVLIVIFEIIGTVAFSISGVIVAQKKKMDLLGVLIMGLVTAVGGGITRDIFLGQTPPKAFINPMLPIISIVTSLAVFLLVTKYGVKEPNVYYNRIFFIMDSIGLAVFTVVGIEVSQSVYGFNLLLNLFMGTLTSVGGGVMRDLFSCQIPVIFTKHFYAMASTIGAAIKTDYEIKGAHSVLTATEAAKWLREDISDSIKITDRISGANATAIWSSKRVDGEAEYGASGRIKNCTLW